METKIEFQTFNTAEVKHQFKDTENNSILIIQKCNNRERVRNFVVLGIDGIVQLRDFLNSVIGTYPKP